MTFNKTMGDVPYGVAPPEVAQNAQLERIEAHLAHIEESLSALVKVGDVLLDCVVPVRQEMRGGVLLERLAILVGTVGLIKAQEAEAAPSGGSPPEPSPTIAPEK